MPDTCIISLLLLIYLPYSFAGNWNLSVGTGASSSVNEVVIDGHGLKQYEPGDMKRLAHVLEEFEILDIQLSAEVEVLWAPKNTIEIEASGKSLSLIQTSIDAGKLTIKAKRPMTDQPIRIRLQVTKLQRLVLSAAGFVHLQNIDQEQLKLKLSGSGEIVAHGRVKRLFLVLSGAGEIDTQELNATQVEAVISGSGDIDLSVEKYLRASISGSGDIRYRGNPGKIVRKISGTGDIDAI